MFNIRLKADLPRFLKGFRGEQRKVRKGIAIGMAQIMEEIRGKIASTTLGPRKWDEPEKPSGHAYAMAMLIAKSEGFADFSKGSAGRSRVGKLAPTMPTFRPPGKQKVWIQSGQLRKTLDWRVVSTDGQNLGNLVGAVTNQPGSIATGYLNSPMDYAEKMEEKYDFAQTETKNYMRTGRPVEVLKININRELGTDGQR